METTHKITLNVDITVAMIEGMRPEELVVAGEEYLLGLSPSLEGAPNTWGTISDKSGKRDLAKMTEPLKITGVVVRDPQGTPLVQSGSAIPTP